MDKNLLLISILIIVSVFQEATSLESVIRKFFHLQSGQSPYRLYNLFHQRQSHSQNSVSLSSKTKRVRQTFDYARDGWVQFEEQQEEQEDSQNQTQTSMETGFVKVRSQFCLDCKTLSVAATFRTNLIRVFGYILHRPRMELTSDLYTSLFFMLSTLRLNEVNVIGLVPLLSDLSFLTSNERFVKLFQGLEEHLPVYLRCSATYWKQAILEKQVDMEKILKPDGNQALVVDLLDKLDKPTLDSVALQSPIEGPKNASEQKILYDFNANVLHLTRKIQENKENMGQYLLGPLIQYFPRTLVQPNLEESVHVLTEYLEENRLPEWQLFVRQMDEVDAENPFEIVRHFLEKLYKDPESPPPLKDSIEVVLGNIRSRVPTAINPNYLSLSYLATYEQPKFEFMLQYVRKGAYPAEVHASALRTAFYLRQGYVRHLALTAYFNPYAYSTPTEVLIAGLDRIIKRQPDLKLEILDSVGSVYSHAVYMSRYLTLPATLSDDVLDANTMVLGLRSPDLDPAILAEMEYLIGHVDRGSEQFVQVMGQEVDVVNSATPFVFALNVYYGMFKRDLLSAEAEKHLKAVIETKCWAAKCPLNFKGAKDEVFRFELLAGVLLHEGCWVMHSEEVRTTVAVQSTIREQPSTTTTKGTSTETPIKSTSKETPPKVTPTEPTIIATQIETSTTQQTPEESTTERASTEFLTRSPSEEASTTQRTLTDGLTAEHGSKERPITKETSAEGPCTEKIPTEVPTMLKTPTETPTIEQTPKGDSPTIPETPTEASSTGQTPSASSRSTEGPITEEVPKQSQTIKDTSREVSQTAQQTAMRTSTDTPTSPQTSKDDPITQRTSSETPIIDQTPLETPTTKRKSTAEVSITPKASTETPTMEQTLEEATTTQQTPWNTSTTEAAKSIETPRTLMDIQTTQEVSQQTTPTTKRTSVEIPSTEETSIEVTTQNNPAEISVEDATAHHTPTEPSTTQGTAKRIPTAEQITSTELTVTEEQSGEVSTTEETPTDVRRTEKTLTETPIAKQTPTEASTTRKALKETPIIQETPEKDPTTEEALTESSTMEATSTKQIPKDVTTTQQPPKHGSTSQEKSVEASTTKRTPTDTPTTQQTPKEIPIAKQTPTEASTTGEALKESPITQETPQKGPSTEEVLTEPSTVDATSMKQTPKELPTTQQPSKQGSTVQKTPGEASTSKQTPTETPTTQQTPKEGTTTKQTPTATSTIEPTQKPSTTQLTTRTSIAVHDEWLSTQPPTTRFPREATPEWTVPSDLTLPTEGELHTASTNPPTAATTPTTRTPPSTSTIDPILTSTVDQGVILKVVGHLRLTAEERERRHVLTMLKILREERYRAVLEKIEKTHVLVITAFSTALMMAQTDLTEMETVDREFRLFMERYMAQLKRVRTILEELTTEVQPTEPVLVRLIVAVPTPVGEEEERRFRILKGILQDRRLFNAIASRLKNDEYRNVGALLKALLRLESQLSARITAEQKETMEFYIDKVRTSGMGAGKVTWGVHVKEVRKKIDVAAIFDRALGFERLSTENKKNFNYVVGYLAKSRSVLDNWDKWVYYTKAGEFTQALFKRLLGHPYKTPKLEGAVRALMGLIDYEGGGAEPAYDDARP